MVVVVPGNPLAESSSASPVLPASSIWLLVANRAFTAACSLALLAFLCLAISRFFVYCQLEVSSPFSSRRLSVAPSDHCSNRLLFNEFFLRPSLRNNETVPQLTPSSRSMRPSWLKSTRRGWEL